jgi:hypothetical protein
METQHSSHNIYNSINGSHLVEVDVIRRGIMDSCLRYRQPVENRLALFLNFLRQLTSINNPVYVCQAPLRLFHIQHVHKKIGRCNTISLDLFPAKGISLHRQFSQLFL